MTPTLVSKIVAPSFCFIFALILFFGVAEDVSANNAYGASGWSMPAAEYVGDDITTCGASSTVGQIVLAEHATNTPINGPVSFAWAVYVRDSDMNIIDPMIMLSGETESPLFCYQMSSDYVQILTADSATFYRHDGISVGVEPENPELYHGEFYRGYVHLLRKVVLNKNIALVSPISQVVNVNPTYTVSTQVLPTPLYNSDGLYTTKYAAENQTNLDFFENNVSSSGGVGSRTLPSLALTDGLYYWVAYKALNGDFTMSNGVRAQHNPFSAQTPLAAFILDTTPPVTTVTMTQTGTGTGVVYADFTNTVQDVTSGLVSTTYHLNEISPTPTPDSLYVPIGGYPTNELSGTLGVTLAEGGTYEYFAVTVDRAGNIAISTIQTFIAPAQPPIAEVLTPPASSLQTVEYSASNFIDFEGQGRDSANNIKPAGDYTWQWVTGTCDNSGDLYSNQRLFATSSASNLIKPDGSTERVYLRIQNIASGLWSTNCPYVDVEINCPVNQTWNGSDCVIVGNPNLISQNLTLSAGPYTEGIQFSVSAEVENIGTQPTATGFDNNFSYSWDGGANWTNGAMLPHAALGVGASSVDNAVFTPGQSGNLLFQHCVDSNNVIPEGVDETPNCTIVGPVVVNAVELSGLGCIITTGSSTCNGALNWNLNTAPSPSVYSVTRSELHSSNISGNNESVTLNWGSNTIEARSGAMALRTLALLGSCDTGSGANWNGVSCASQPVLKVTPASTIIRSGKTASVVLGIISNINLSCTVYGINLVPNNFTHTANVAEVTYPYVTRPLTSDQIVQLTCTAAGVSATEQARISVLGIMQEI